MEFIYLIIISELVGGVAHVRRQETEAFSGSPVLEMQAWFTNTMMPELLQEMPGRTEADFRVDYVKLIELP